MNHQHPSTPCGRRRFSLLAAALLTAACALPNAALAQTNFPGKAVTIVVPYTAGGASDVQARLIGQKLSQLWGQPVVVENKPGASAAIGMQFVAQAAALAVGDHPAERVRGVVEIAEMPGPGRTGGDAGWLQAVLQALGAMLLTWVNLAYYQSLMAGARAAIEAGRYADYKAEVEAGWAAGDIAAI